MFPLELRSDRLLLRDFHDEDVVRMFAYARLPAYLEHYDGEAPTYDAVQQLVSLFRRWAMETPRTRYQLAITLNFDLIGTCGVRKQQDDEAEFGCELDPAFWGHGYAYEASAALLAFVRNELPIGRIVARTRPENTSAIRLAERLGFEMTAAGLLVLKAEAHI